jgi:hypothetical protein
MDYFIKIDDPKGLRVALMSAARDSIIMQTTLEELQLIRKNKLALLNYAKEDFRQITSLCKKLSETIADDKYRKEILDLIKAREDTAHTYKTETKTQTKSKIDALPVLKEETMPRIKKPATAVIQKRSNKANNNTLPEIREENLPAIAMPIKPQMQVQTKTEVDRLEYTLSQIEKKLADLQK